MTTQSLPSLYERLGGVYRPLRATMWPGPNWVGCPRVGLESTCPWTGDCPSGRA
jgi:hypothetical protein